MARVVCVYREGMDYSRTVSDWIESFYRRTGRKIEVLDPDTSESFCRAYDVVEYPSVLAIADDGKLQNMWRGASMPLIDEVNYYML